jgi:cell division protein FtsB
MATLTILAFVAGISAGLVVVLNLIFGSLAVALLHSVVLEVRQTSARDRAELAARMATQARERSQEHIKFATLMGRQLQAARAENAQLGARTRELEARLSDAETELGQVRDALWISEAAEKRARAALVVAEQDGQSGRHLRPA